MLTTCEGNVTDLRIIEESWLANNAQYDEQKCVDLLKKMCIYK